MTFMTKLSKARAVPEKASIKKREMGAPFLGCTFSMLGDGVEWGGVGSTLHPKTGLETRTTTVTEVVQTLLKISWLRQNSQETSGMLTTRLHSWRETWTARIVPDSSGHHKDRVGRGRGGGKLWDLYEFEKYVGGGKKMARLILAIVIFYQTTWKAEGRISYILLTNWCSEQQAAEKLHEYRSTSK